MRRILEYSLCMPSEKMSFTLPDGLPGEIRQAAEEKHLPVSVWMAHAAEAEVRRQRRQALVDEFENENGPLATEELAEARAALATAEAKMIAAERRTG